MERIEELKEFWKNLSSKYAKNSYAVKLEDIVLKSGSSLEKYEILFHEILFMLFNGINVNLMNEYNSIKNELYFYGSKDEKENFIAKQKLLYRDTLINTAFAYFDFKKLPHLFDDEIFIRTISSAFHSFNFHKIEEFEVMRVSNVGDINMMYDKIGKEIIEEYINEPVKSLNKFKILQIIEYELKQSDFKEKNRVASDIYYPLVFKNNEFYQLFLCCIEAHGKAKTTLSKFLEIFQDEGYIRNDPNTNKFFYQFVKKEFNITMSRIEYFTSYNDGEKNTFKIFKEKMK
ncbi:hypothetical protein SAMN04488096_104204 [Mesonia phycicola]|uniref:Uncharacterized protein n=1 Tax=Mesonia phycicola TaxID=579105 RepID=A0A1M6DWG1_9FLAO|nr:hypothetical protein [Mesonia phycicola]SHI77515.1 hypothetical protein SAMN04488096_104204 [Mesonia phycicola]